MDENQNPEQETPNELAGKMNAWRKANPEATLTIIEEEVDAELAKIRGNWSLICPLENCTKSSVTIRHKS